ncbi:MAG: hypothetical protein ABJB47_01455, partial [Actinomycetota bacterium]
RRVMTTDDIQYYAIIDQSATRESPAGLLRRRRPATGGFRDEALVRNLSWEFSPIIAEWERAESTDDLVEVTAEEAKQIIEQFRVRWTSADQ